MTHTTYIINVIKVIVRGESWQKTSQFSDHREAIFLKPRRVLLARRVYCITYGRVNVQGQEGNFCNREVLWHLQYI